MKTILFHYPDLDQNRLFDSNDFGFNDPFIYLKERLFSLGYDLKTSDDHPLDNCAWVIFFDNPPSKLIPLKQGIKSRLKSIIKPWIKKKNKIRDLYSECVEGDFHNISIVLMENNAICPGNFSKMLHDKFSIIFTWNDNYVDNKKFFKFYWPQVRELPKINIIDFKDKKLLVNISRNRYLSVPNDLYAERRKAIAYFEKNFPNDFDLFGIGWNKPVGRWQKIFPWLTPIFSSYRGPIKNKAEVMCRYKFSLCYENLSGQTGYITEKIFDSMRCNTVPIYWGASNVENFIDPAAFIDRRKFKSDTDLADFITNVSESEYNQYIRAIDAFLKSEKYHLFSSENFANTIINKLNIKNQNA